MWQRPRVYFVGSLYDAVASRDDDGERNAPSVRPALCAPSVDAHVFSERLYGDRRGFAACFPDPRTPRWFSRRFRAASRARVDATSETGTPSGRPTSSPPRRMRSSVRCRAGRVRFFSDASARAHLHAPSESGRVRARFERARRVARRRRATTPGWRFFPFCSSRRLLFFSRLVNTRSRRNLDCGRDVRSPGRPRARIGRRHARNATGHSPPGDYRRARARAAVAAAAAPLRPARDASANSANVSFLAKRFRFFFTNASSDV